MTIEREEFFTEKYQEGNSLFLAKLMHHQKVLARLVQHLLDADMGMKTLDEVKASLHDAFVTAGELDSICDAELDSKVKGLLRLYEEVEIEIKGDPVEPMGGMSPRDFY